MALQQSRGGENEEFSGNWVGIGRIRFTFLSGDVISRQGETKAKQGEREGKEGWMDGGRKGRREEGLSCHEKFGGVIDANHRR